MTDERFRVTPPLVERLAEDLRNARDNGYSGVHTDDLLAEVAVLLGKMSTEERFRFETFTAGDGLPAIRVSRIRPTCPHCGAFTRNHDDGCWSCSRCGASGDTGEHAKDLHR